MADFTSNSLSGDNSGNAFQARDVHGDVTINSQRRRTTLVNAVAAGGVLLIAIFAGAAHLGDTGQARKVPPSAAPPSSLSSSATSTPTTTASPAAARTSAPVAAPPAEKPAVTGPGYLVAANSDKNVADLYPFATDAIMWAKGTSGQYNVESQRSWVREFSDSRKDVFRLRNGHRNLCLETAGDRLTGGDCSWDREHQLWRLRGTQFVNAKSGECLEAADGDQPMGVPLVVSSCGDNPGQRWRITP